MASASSLKPYWCRSEIHGTWIHCQESLVLSDNLTKISEQNWHVKETDFQTYLVIFQADGAHEILDVSYLFGKVRSFVLHTRPNHVSICIKDKRDVKGRRTAAYFSCLLENRKSSFSKRAELLISHYSCPTILFLLNFEKWIDSSKTNFICTT